MAKELDYGQYGAVVTTPLIGPVHVKNYTKPYAEGGGPIEATGATEEEARNKVMGGDEKTKQRGK